MHTAVGIFRQCEPAAPAVEELLNRGIPAKSITFLAGQQAESRLESMPTSDSEAEGMGKTMGAYLGAVFGVGAGAAIGSAIASMFVPGLGTVFAAGLGAAAALGLGGAAAGANIGHASEHALDLGIPKDDVFFYRSLLRDHLTLVLINADTEEQAASAQRLLAGNGSEDVETARQRWHHQPEAIRLAS